ncbi:type II secretion system protein GspM [Citrobacter farmeri]|uniref:General secretion pathway protein GspM n=1 Tax=Citrobacter amalonaticus Y19 TaxID=1261127 RepID=A0A0F6REB3_CITAM|nr:type II secretion system protein M [Citrobacter amalonaticus]AKE58385.1 general secretion pathway protein GspM [Citrobacter amalonaticus Y19]EKV5653506.1 type II secretion system protein M [Citrobacter farmeri]
MRERIAQLKSRYQNYSIREKACLKICAAVMCCAAVYYIGAIPLDNMIQSSKSTLARQKETLNWMRGEIDKNHLQVQQVKTDNPRSIVEKSARDIHLSLTDVRQDGQSLSFVVGRINIFQLKNWLREMNMSSGIRLEKMSLTPVDHLSDVNAKIQLTWNKVT